MVGEDCKRSLVYVHNALCGYQLQQLKKWIGQIIEVMEYIHRQNSYHKYKQ